MKIRFDAGIEVGIGIGIRSTRLQTIQPSQHLYSLCFKIDANRLEVGIRDLAERVVEGQLSQRTVELFFLFGEFNGRPGKVGWPHPGAFAGENGLDDGHKEPTEQKQAGDRNEDGFHSDGCLFRPAHLMQVASPLREPRLDLIEPFDDRGHSATWSTRN